MFPNLKFINVPTVPFGNRSLNRMNGIVELVRLTVNVLVDVVTPLMNVSKVKEDPDWVAATRLTVLYAFSTNGSVPMKSLVFQ